MGAYYHNHYPAELQGRWEDWPSPLGVDLLQLAEHEGEDTGGRAQHEDEEDLPVGGQSASRCQWLICWGERTALQVSRNEADQDTARALGCSEGRVPSPTDPFDRIRLHEMKIW
jgi:hypothetical protein